VDGALNIITQAPFSTAPTNRSVPDCLTRILYNLNILKCVIYQIYFTRRKKN